MTALSRLDGPSTSAEAAHALGTTQNLKDLVLRCLREHGPATTHQIAELTGLSIVTVSPRIKPLRDAGLVLNSGLRHEGRSVWQATPTTH